MAHTNPSLPLVECVPVELYLEIFKGLSQGDLAACARVCKKWGTEAQWTLEGKYPLINSLHSAQAFKRSLERKPEHRKRVEGLWLRANHRNRDNNVQSWLGTALVQLAPLLPNLRYLTIQNWGPVAPGPEVIAALRSFTNVTKLELRRPVFRGFGDLEDFVFNLPRLSHLRLDDPRPIGPPGPLDSGPLGKAEYHTRALRLTTLELWSIVHPFPELVQWLGQHRCRPSELVAYRIAGEPAFGSLQLLLVDLGSYLKVFKFFPIFQALFYEDISDPRGTPMSIVDLSHNPQVTSITFRVWYAAAPECIWVPWVINSALHRGAPLRDIQFEMSLDSAKSLDTMAWGQTTHLLMNRRPDTLRKVAFIHTPTLDEYMYGNVAVRDATPAFRRYFGCLEPAVTLEMINAPAVDLGQLNDE